MVLSRLFQGDPEVPINIRVLWTFSRLFQQLGRGFDRSGGRPEFGPSRHLMANAMKSGAIFDAFPNVGVLCANLEPPIVNRALE
jgi:hypothetical protein